MTVRRRLTPEEQSKVAEMREHGLGMKDIARRMNCTAGSARWACLKLGAELPTPRALRTRHHLQLPIMQRGNYVARAFTPEDDRQLLTLEAEGFGDSEIGRRMKRRPSSIRSRLITLARRDERAAATTLVKRTHKTTQRAATAAPHSMEPA